MILPEIKELIDTEHTIARALFDECSSVLDVFSKISDFIKAIGPKLPADEYYSPEEGIFIAKDAKISPNATILAPTVIGHNAEIRPGAYIRGSAIIGDGAVIGNSTEIKNAIIFDGAQLPHYNYVGDSIIGYRAHLGAGAIISNFKLDHKPIKIRSGDEVLETGLRKMGAILGDFAEIGCGSVIFPGSIVGRRTLVYPLTPLRGVIPSDSIIHEGGRITPRNIEE